MASGMEVDGEPPPSDSNGHGFPLKRSNSAPMINMQEDSMSICVNVKHSQDDLCKPTSSLSSPSLLLFSANSSFRPFDHTRRTRHNSTNSHSLSHPNGNNNISTPVKVPSRVCQIKREEEVQRNTDREIHHERELQSAMQMSQSWDEHFSLDEAPCIDPHKGRPRSLSESLHIWTTGLPVSSSPSPTRVGKQCFSPSMQVPVMFNGHNFQFSPSPSPSPTRRVARRSLSPIVTLKPSSLSHKRKLDPDTESGFSQPKRIFAGSLLAPASLSSPNSNPQPTQHTYASNQRLFENLRPSHSSLSAGSFDDSASENSSCGALTSSSASVSTAFPFGTLMQADSCSSTTTDSESDMSEPLVQRSEGDSTTRQPVPYGHGQ